MSNRIEGIIEEMENYLENCKYARFSDTKIVVNKEDIDDYLRKLRANVPEEIKYYQRIINNKDAILKDAKDKAQALIEQATVHTNKLISEHEIMQQAYAQANEVVTSATIQAQQILDSATMEANEVKTAAMQYMDDILNYLENIIVSSTNAAVTNYETLIGGLNQYRDIIQSNRAELHPVEEDLENVVLENPSDNIEEE